MCRRRVRVQFEEIFAFVAALGNRRIDGNTGEQVVLVALTQLFDAVVLRKDLTGLVAFAALKDGHVLDNAEHGKVGLFNEGDLLAHVLQRDLLRRGHEDAASQRRDVLQVVHHGQVLVRSTRWRVDDQIVEFAFAPVDVQEELLDHVIFTRPLPYHRLFE